MYHGWNQHLCVPSLLQAGSHQRVYPTSKTDLDADVIFVTSISSSASVKLFTLG